MPGDFDEIERRFAGPAAPVADDFDAIEARFAGPSTPPEDPDVVYRRVHGLLSGDDVTARLAERDARLGVGSMPEGEQFEGAMRATRNDFERRETERRAVVGEYVPGLAAAEEADPALARIIRRNFPAGGAWMQDPERRAAFREAIKGADDVLSLRAKENQGALTAGRLLAAPLKGATAGRLDVGTAAGGERTQQHSRERAGGGLGFVESGLEVAGAAVALSGAGKVAAALRVPGALAGPLALGAHSAAGAPEGQGWEAFKRGVALGGVAGGAEKVLGPLAQAVAPEARTMLTRAVVRGMEAAKGAAGWTAGGLAVGSDDLAHDAGLGAIFGLVHSGRAVTENEAAAAYAHAYRAAKQEQTLRGRVREDVRGRMGEIDARNAQDRAAREQMRSEVSVAALPEGARQPALGPGGVPEVVRGEATSRPLAGVADLPAGEAVPTTPALPRGAIQAGPPPEPKAWTDALDAFQNRPEGKSGTFLAQIHARAGLNRQNMADLRAMADRVGVAARGLTSKRALVDALLTAARGRASRPTLTDEQAGEVKARLLEEGLATKEEVVSPELEQAAQGALASGATPEQAAEVVKMLGPVRRGDGSVAAGYDPQAVEKGLVQEGRPLAATLKAMNQGIEPVSSGPTADGGGYAVGVDAKGLVRRVEVQPEAPAEKIGGMPAKHPKLSEAFDRFDYGDTNDTPADLADAVERLLESGDAPKSLRRPLQKYRKAVEEDFEEYGGRGDSAYQEEQFVEAVRAEAMKGAPKPRTIPSRGSAPLPSSRPAAEAGAQVPAEPKAAAPKPKVGRKGERGFLGLPSMADLGEAGKRVAVQVRRLLGTETQRVRDLDSPAASEAAGKIGRATNRAKQRLGEMSPALSEALRAASGFGVGKMQAARAAIRPITPRAGSHVRYYPFVEWAEGRVQPGTPHEAEIARTLRDLAYKRGEIFEQIGLLQETPNGIQPFVNRRGVLPRQFDAEWNDWLTKVRLNTPDWTRVVDAWAEATGRPAAEMDTLLREMRDDVTKTGIPGENRQTQAEISRTLKQIPHAIDLGGGRLLHVLSPNPYRYAKGLAERGAARAGVVEEMGQDIGKPGQSGYQNPVSDLGERVRQETGNEGNFTRAMQALHGATPGKPLVSPGSRTAPILRGLNAVLGTAKNLAQTASAIPNTLENAAQIRSAVGTLPFLKGYARFLGNPRAMTTALELEGKITRDILDVSPEAGRPTASAVKMLNAVIARTPLHGRGMNELNERLAGTVFETYAKEEMASGKNFGRSIVMLRSLGYGSSFSAKLARGQGTTAEYDRVVREIASRRTGSNLSKVEQSFIENTRWFGPLQWFAKYAFMRARSAATFARGYVASIKQAVTDPNLSPRERWKIQVEAQRRLVSGAGSTAAVGIGTKLLAALATGGTLGFKQAWKDVEDDVAGAALDGLAYNLIAGPYALVARMLTEDRPVGAKDVIAPVSVAQNVYDFTAERGQYANLPPGERWRSFLSRTAPGVKAYDTILTAFGLGSSEDNDMRTALSSFWKWRRENVPTPTRDTLGYRSEDRERWLTAMKGAYLEATRGGTPEDVYAHIVEGLGVAGKDDAAVRASLRSRKVLDLKDVPENERAEWQARMRAALHSDVLKVLEAHDELLERLAGSGGREQRPAREGRGSRGAAPLSQERVERAIRGK